MYPPIALVLHGLAIGGGIALTGRGTSEAPIDEVEIVADDTPKTPDQNRSWPPINRSIPMDKAVT